MYIYIYIVHIHEKSIVKSVQTCEIQNGQTMEFEILRNSKIKSDHKLLGPGYHTLHPESPFLNHFNAARLFFVQTVGVSGSRQRGKKTTYTSLRLGLHLVPKFTLKRADDEGLKIGMNWGPLKDVAKIYFLATPGISL